MPIQVQNVSPAVFPIVLHDAGSSDYRVLGTGFITTASGVLVTAKHVFADAGRPDGTGCHTVDIPSLRLYPISHVKGSTEWDVAVGTVAVPDGKEPLPIASENAPMNADILTIEYSQWRSVRRSEGDVELRLRSYHRKGNVLSYYEDDFFGRTMRLVDLSFPALAGASGAPAIAAPTIGDWSVIGMIIGNVGRHLLPAHVERTVTEDKTTEEIRYYLPIGLAISWFHIRAFLESLGVLE